LNLTINSRLIEYNTMSTSDPPIAAGSAPYERQQQLVVKITSPANLQAGFKFEATTPEGRTFLVAVPPGGVKAGQEFDVPVPTEDEELQRGEIIANAYPAPPDIAVVDAAAPLSEATAYPLEEERVASTATAPISSQTPMSAEIAMAAPQPLEVFMDAPEPIGPRGRWRNGLLSCCETVNRGTFWCGCCCQMVQTGQLATRLHLDYAGYESTPEKARRTLLIVLLVFFLSNVISSNIDEDWPWYIQVYILLPFYFYNCWLLYRIRFLMRRRYDIQPTNPSRCARLLQYLFMIPCCCCASIQMVRQTHDEKKWPYDGFAPDGLPLYAPDVDLIEDL